jgi:hypothetical protein
MDWIPELFTWFESVVNVVSAIVTIASAITLIGAIVVFILTVVVKPFGPAEPVPARYQKFFKSLVVRVRRRDNALVPPPAIGTGNSCKFTSKLPGTFYYVHFRSTGNFCVYLNLAGADAETVFDGLRQQAESLKRHFKESLVWEWPSGNATYSIVVNYPGGGVITDDVRKLKKMRRWAVLRLATFRKVFDRRVQDIRAMSASAPPLQKAIP